MGKEVRIPTTLARDTSDVFLRFRRGKSKTLGIGGSWSPKTDDKSYGGVGDGI